MEVKLKGTKLESLINLFSLLNVGEYKSFVLHSLHVAKISSQIVDRLMKEIDTDVVYILGLFHDIGLVFKASLENYELFEDMFPKIADLERIVLTFDKANQHSKISYGCVQRFPFLSNNEIVKSALYHHVPIDKIPESEKIALVSNAMLAADVLSRLFLKRQIEFPDEEFLKESMDFLDKSPALHPEVSRVLKEILKDPSVLSQLFDDESHFCSKKDLYIDDVLHFAAIFSALLDFRSPYTRSHTFLVDYVVEKLACEIFKGEFDVNFLKVVALFHDIGKIKIPLQILHKHGRLNEYEMAVMKTHVVETKLMLTKASLEKYADLAGSHHERLDGSGYPLKLTEKQLSIYSRILQVADVFAALTEKRPYRDALEPKEAIEVVREEVESGKLDDYVFEKLEQLVKNNLELPTQRNIMENLLGVESVDQIVVVDANLVV
ncbi:HD domain-containing phosphohydrolase [Pseudothermotoga thermarum]|uniref:Metal dependent phosphohydrolase n=1 Tax=Pseudothermotoga thermarum DSM 5069 TaxID=688269 RepID=F7YXK8_9THEM|nr:HD domain-containing phosphohydrolase [Pseudothermotoga thermarum]AEH50649.1 metal dependent phosphohydrolase [Pseudothermotoga thermarum DSM 5069]